MTTKFYLDTRGVADGGIATVKVALNSHGSSAYIGTGVRVTEAEWDKKTGKVIVHPLKVKLNILLAEKKLEIDKAIEELTKIGSLKGLTLSQIKNKVVAYLHGGEEKEQAQKDNLFMSRFDRWTESKKKYGTWMTYDQTRKKIREYAKDAETLTFEDITKEWLTGFEEFLKKTSPSANARSIKLRNIRTVFNEAIDDEITTAYPFRKFKIKGESTPSRALPTETLRALFEYPCEEYQREYVDIAKLMFFLCGINFADLVSLKSLKRGRCEYSRLKTNQPCSVKVEPEAAEIIKRYKGNEHLLNISERYKSYKDYLHLMNNALKRVGTKSVPGKKNEGTAIASDISSYFLRYSWATIAAELEIPKETIAAALGHSTQKSVTDIYIRVNRQKKVDEANRKVIDYVLYGKCKE